MSCPLCGTRKAKRFCPAKSTQICTVCCATKREIELDCPMTCFYLREGYSYAREKVMSVQPDKPLKTDRVFDHSFLIANEFFLMELWRWTWESFQSMPQLHDADVLDVLAALEKTYQTLDNGLYYDSTPESSLQQILYTKLKKSIDAQMQNPDVQRHHLKLSTALDGLAFLQQFARMKTSGRPLSRGFLMQLDEIFSKTPSTTPSEEPHIVLP